MSFYQRDITDPHIYRDRYDIVLGFSVFTYIHQVLERLAEITGEALVIETHKLDGNLEKDYLAPVRTFFPVHHVLGESDWGRSLSSDEKRAVIVFARDEQTLQRVLGRSGTSRHQGTIIDVQRTALQGQFFKDVTFQSADELLAGIRAMEIDLAGVAGDPDLAEAVYSGKTYWLIFLKGYCQYLDGLILGRGNIYFDYIRDYYTPRRHDPDLSDEFSDPNVALQRVAARFRDVDRFRQAPHSYVPTPITIFQTGDPERDDLVLYDAGSGELLHAHAVDGWHRLFVARLFGAATVPAEVVEASI